MIVLSLSFRCAYIGIKGLIFVIWPLLETESIHRHIFSRSSARLLVWMHKKNEEKRRRRRMKREYINRWIIEGLFFLIRFENLLSQRICTGAKLIAQTSGVSYSDQSNLTLLRVSIQISTKTKHLRRKRFLLIMYGSRSCTKDKCVVKQNQSNWANASLSPGSLHSWVKLFHIAPTCQLFNERRELPFQAVIEFIAYMRRGRTTTGDLCTNVLVTHTF